MAEWMEELERLAELRDKGLITLFVTYIEGLEPF